MPNQKLKATRRELADRGKTGKTIANAAEALRSFCNWCVIRNYLSENPLAELAHVDATSTLTANTYGRVRDERLATVVEIVAKRVLSGQIWC